MTLKGAIFWVTQPSSGPTKEPPKMTNLLKPPPRSAVLGAFQAHVPSRLHPYPITFLKIVSTDK